MKKLTALTLALIMVLTCSFFLFSCGGNDISGKIPGTYSMKTISGSVTANGQTTELTSDLYSKYDVILNTDGSAKIVSAGTNGVEYEQSGTWKYEEGKLKITTETAGVKVTEVMDWKDNIITYETEQSAQGVTVSMKIVLEKK